jgi:hypothetical protein
MGEMQLLAIFFKQIKMILYKIMQIAVIIQLRKVELDSYIKIMILATNFNFYLIFINSKLIDIECK